MFKAFPNARLEHIRCLEVANVIATFGFRTCVIMNDKLEVLCKFLDSNKDEKYQCGEFFKNTTENFCTESKYFLALGGATGVIKLLDLQEGSMAGYLVGHTGAIRDIKVFSNYLVSSSEDSSVRLWSLETLGCIGVCGGLFGHKDSVLSIDVLYDNSMIVSAGIDCAIKQWRIFTDGSSYLYDEPFTNFNTVHRCSITKVRYYGNMIISLSNNVISVVFNNRDKVDERFNLTRNDVLFIGGIHVFNNCKTFHILEHILIGMGNNGDVYMFDLRSIPGETQPFLTSSGVSAVEDFVVMSGALYISSGNGIHRVSFDLDYFTDI